MLSTHSGFRLARPCAAAPWLDPLHLAVIAIGRGRLFSPVSRGRVVACIPLLLQGRGPRRFPVPDHSLPGASLPCDLATLRYREIARQGFIDLRPSDLSPRTRGRIADKTPRRRSRPAYFPRYLRDRSGKRYRDRLSPRAPARIVPIALPGPKALKVKQAQGVGHRKPPRNRLAKRHADPQRFLGRRGTLE
jgi:hypothetical protein